MMLCKGKMKIEKEEKKRKKEAHCYFLIDKVLMEDMDLTWN